MEGRATNIALPSVYGVGCRIIKAVTTLTFKQKDFFGNILQSPVYINLTTNHVEPTEYDTAAFILVQKTLFT